MSRVYLMIDFGMGPRVKTWWKLDAAPDPGTLKFKGFDGLRAWHLVEAESAAAARHLIGLERVGAGELYETRADHPGGRILASSGAREARP